MQKPIVVRTSHPYEYTLEVDGHLGDWMPIFQSPLHTREVDQKGLDSQTSATQVEWRDNCGIGQCEGNVTLNTNGGVDSEKMTICGGQVVCLANTCIYREDPLENDNEVLSPSPTPPTLSAQETLPIAHHQEIWSGGDHVELVLSGENAPKPGEQPLEYLERASWEAAHPATEA